jgi:hypothetical protein
MPTPTYVVRKPVYFYCSGELINILKFIYMFVRILMFLCVGKVTVALNTKHSLPESFQVITLFYVRTMATVERFNLLIRIKQCTRTVHNLHNTSCVKYSMHSPVKMNFYFRYGNSCLDVAVTT